MARIQLSYPGYGLASIDMIAPQYGDSPRDAQLSREDYYAGKLPVLWLLHGGMGCSSDWLRFTEVERFAAEKRLFVVSISGENGAYVDMARGAHWESILTEYVWDMIHDMFPLASERPEDNSIAGLSMGGYGALRNGLKHPEKYGRIGAFSAGVRIVERVGEDSAFGRDLKDVFGQECVGTPNDLFWAAQARKDSGNPFPPIYLSCGTKDKLYKDNADLRDHLQALGADVTWDESEHGHEWAFWNRQIEKFINWLP